jgi:hypothetical protein
MIGDIRDKTHKISEDWEDLGDLVSACPGTLGEDEKHFKQ